MQGRQDFLHYAIMYFLEKNGSLNANLLTECINDFAPWVLKPTEREISRRLKFMSDSPDWRIMALPEHPDWFHFMNRVVTIPFPWEID